MQTIAVLSGEHNPNGHTEDEIISELRGHRGGRYLTFRYERLDSANVKLGDLTNVLTAEVDQNWLADIKRTAKFEVIDDGVINYLSDRIKPWVRLHIYPYGDNDWVQWPQGVFLLSSPKRGIADNGVVTRNVEAYDQLQTLIDDSVTSRYTIPLTTALTEGFEDDTYELTIGGSWSRSSIRAKTGTYSMKSASIGDYGTTDMTIVVPAGSTTLTFSYWCSTESGYDFFKVLGDSTELLSVSGVGVAWVDASVTVTGKSVVTFRFTKDVSDLGGENGVWVDNVSFTDASTRVTDVVRSLLSGYQTSIVSSASVVPTVMEWDIGTTKLKIINELLSSINYDSLSFDENGVAIVRPYKLPTERTSGYTYATDEHSVILPEISQEYDLFKVPNTWVMVVSEPDRSVLSSTYVNNDPASPTSTVNRGRTITDFRTDSNNAVDQATLDAKVARLAFESSQVYEKLSFSTAIMPFHSGNDVYSVTIDELAVSSSYVETSWSFELKSGATMKHTVRRVVPV